MKDNTQVSRMEALIGRMEAAIGRWEQLVASGVAQPTPTVPTDTAAIEAAEKHIERRKRELGLVDYL